MSEFQRSASKRSIWIMLALIVVLLVAACGGDDDDDAANPTATSSSGQQAATATEATDTDPTEAEPTAESTEAPTTEPTEAREATATSEEPAATEAEATEAEGDPTEATSASEPQLPATVTDVNGEEVTVADTSRIIPLNGDIAEIIFALGMGDRVVATDTSATYPEEVNALPKIGYQRQLAAEGILALSPTLVIGNELAGPPEVLDQIRTAGVTVVIFPEVTTIDGIGGKVEAIAGALGIPEVGAQLAGETTAEIEEAQELAASVEETRSAMFLYLRGATTQLVGGEGTTADAMITAVGATNAATEAGIVDFQPMTAESLAAAQPDLLILLTAGLESVGGVEGLLEIPGVAQTPAAQNGKVIDFDDQYFLGFGPRTGQALHDLLLALHPELES